MTSVERVPYVGETPVERTRRTPRQEAMLRAGIRAFHHDGFHGTNINAIGAQAGLTGTAMYRHFRGKDELLAAVVWEAVHLFAGASREALAPRRPANESLVALVTSLVDVTVDNPELMAVYALEGRHLQPDLAAELRRHEHLYREEYVHLLSLIRPELPASEARVLVRAAIYAVASACHEPNEVPDTQLRATLMTAVMAMLLGRG